MDSAKSNIPQRRHSSFFLPMLLLPKRKRNALKSLYYYCRVVDDAIDEASSRQEALNNLHYWKQQNERIFAKVPDGKALNEVSQQLLENAVTPYSLERQPFDALLQGMEFDCQINPTIETETQLESYCYQVAGSVGISAMRIFGLHGEEANRFAIALGEALQLTNILRDQKKDHDLKRNYIPASWPDTERASRLITKAKHRFEETSKLQKTLSRTKLLPAIAMRYVYYKKLRRIEESFYLNNEQI